MFKQGQYTRLQLGVFILGLIWIGLVFSPGLSGPFVSDDEFYIVDNPNLNQLAPENTGRIFTQLNNFEYLPIRDLSLYIDYQLFSDQPLGYKVHNLLIYLLLFIVVFFTSWQLLRLFETRDEQQLFWIALSITLLYMLHPTHVESVSWISGRKDLLSTLFSVAALGVFCRTLYIQRYGWGLPACALLLVLALLSKSVVMPMSIVMTLVAIMHFRANHSFAMAVKRGLLLGSPFLVISLLMTIMHSEIAVTDIRLDIKLYEIERQFISELLHILGKLTELTLLPYSLSLQYRVVPESGYDLSQLLLATITLIVATLGMFFALYKRSLVGLGSITFLLFCLPFVQLIPFQTWSLVSDRFLMCAIYGVAIALTLILFRLPIKWALISVISLTLFFSGISFIRGFDWQSEEQLIESNYQHQSANATASVMKMLRVDLNNKAYEEAKKTAQTIENAHLRQAAERLALFYQFRDMAIKENSPQYLNSAIQSLIEMHSFLLQNKQTSLGIHNFNGSKMLASELASAYTRYLQLDNNAMAHYNLALGLMQLLPEKKGREGARYHLQEALNLGLPPTLAQNAREKLQLLEGLMK